MREREGEVAGGRYIVSVIIKVPESSARSTGIVCSSFWEGLTRQVCIVLHHLPLSLISTL